MPAIEGYPTTGLLQFFTKADADGLYSCDFIENDDLEQVSNNTDGSRVIYHKEVIENNERLQTEFVDTEIEYKPLGGEYAMSFELLQEIPSQSNYSFEKIVGDIYEMDDSIDEYVDDNIVEGSKIGGYANFTQEDPRSYTQLDKNWLLLFQMDTEYDVDGVDIMWGDDGVINFFIEPERLVQLDFSRVWYNWDCS